MASKLEWLRERLKEVEPGVGQWDDALFAVAHTRRAAREGRGTVFGMIVSPDDVAGLAPLLPELEALGARWRDALMKEGDKGYRTLFLSCHTDAPEWIPPRAPKPDPAISEAVGRLRAALAATADAERCWSAAGQPGPFVFVAGGPADAAGLLAAQVRARDLLPPPLEALYAAIDGLAVGTGTPKPLLHPISEIGRGWQFGRVEGVAELWLTGKGLVEIHRRVGRKKKKEKVGRLSEFLDELARVYGFLPSLIP